MTIQSITAEDRIINQQGRDDSFLGMTYLEALGKCQPIIVMDEPQEGMDTEAAVARLATLNPLAKLRYSATHKVVKNLLPILVWCSSAKILPRRRRPNTILFRHRSEEHEQP